MPDMPSDAVNAFTNFIGQKNATNAKIAANTVAQPTTPVNAPAKAPKPGQSDFTQLVPDVAANLTQAAYQDARMLQYQQAGSLPYESASGQISMPFKTYDTPHQHSFWDTINPFSSSNVTSQATSTDMDTMAGNLAGKVVTPANAQYLPEQYNKQNTEIAIARALGANPSLIKKPMLLFAAAAKDMSAHDINHIMTFSDFADVFNTTIAQPDGWLNAAKSMTDRLQNSPQNIENVAFGQAISDVAKPFQGAIHAFRDAFGYNGKQGMMIGDIPVGKDVGNFLQPVTNTIGKGVDAIFDVQHTMRTLHHIRATQGNDAYLAALGSIVGTTAVITWATDGLGKIIQGIGGKVLSRVLEEAGIDTSGLSFSELEQLAARANTPAGHARWVRFATNWMHKIPAADEGKLMRVLAEHGYETHAPGITEADVAGPVSTFSREGGVGASEADLAAAAGKVEAPSTVNTRIGSLISRTASKTADSKAFQYTAGLPFKYPKVGLNFQLASLLMYNTNGFGLAHGWNDAWDKTGKNYVDPKTGQPVSFGRDVAGATGLTPGSFWYNAVSGPLDLWTMFALDPTYAVVKPLAEARHLPPLRSRTDVYNLFATNRNAQALEKRILFENNKAARNLVKYRDEERKLITNNRSARASALRAMGASEEYIAKAVSSTKWHPTNAQLDAIVRAKHADADSYSTLLRLFPDFARTIQPTEGEGLDFIQKLTTAEKKGDIPDMVASLAEAQAMLNPNRLPSYGAFTRFKDYLYERNRDNILADSESALAGEKKSLTASALHGTQKTLARGAVSLKPEFYQELREFSNKVGKVGDPKTLDLIRRTMLAAGRDPHMVEILVNQLGRSANDMQWKAVYENFIRDQFHLETEAFTNELVQKAGFTPLEAAILRNSLETPFASEIERLSNIGGGGAANKAYTGTVMNGVRNRLDPLAEGMTPTAGLLRSHEHYFALPDYTAWDKFKSDLTKGMLSDKGDSLRAKLQQTAADLIGKPFDEQIAAYTNQQNAINKQIGELKAQAKELEPGTEKMDLQAKIDELRGQHAQAGQERLGLAYDRKNTIAERLGDYVPYGNVEKGGLTAKQALYNFQDSVRHWLTDVYFRKLSLATGSFSMRVSAAEGIANTFRLGGKEYSKGWLANHVAEGMAKAEGVGVKAAKDPEELQGVQRRVYQILQGISDISPTKKIYQGRLDRLEENEMHMDELKQQIQDAKKLEQDTSKLEADLRYIEADTKALKAQGQTLIRSGANDILKGISNGLGMDEFVQLLAKDIIERGGQLDGLSGNHGSMDAHGTGFSLANGHGTGSWEFRNNIDEQSLQGLTKHLNDTAHDPAARQTAGILSEYLDPKLQATAGKTLSSIEKMALHYDDFEKFSRDFSLKGYRPTVWHFTNNKDFAPDKNVFPSLGGVEKPTDSVLFTTSYPENWEDWIKNRPYAVEYDISELTPKVDYDEDKRGLDGIVIKPGAYDKLKKVKTLSKEEAIKASEEAHNKLPQSKESLREVWDKAHAASAKPAGPMGVQERLDAAKEANRKMIHAFLERHPEDYKSLMRTNNHISDFTHQRLAAEVEAEMGPGALQTIPGRNQLLIKESKVNPIDEYADSLFEHILWLSHGRGENNAFFHSAQVSDKVFHRHILDMLASGQAPYSTKLTRDLYVKPTLEQARAMGMQEVTKARNTVKPTFHSQLFSGTDLNDLSNLSDAEIAHFGLPPRHEGEMTADGKIPVSFEGMTNSEVRDAIIASKTPLRTGFKNKFSGPTKGSISRTFDDINGATTSRFPANIPTQVQLPSGYNGMMETMIDKPISAFSNLIHDKISGKIINSLAREPLYAAELGRQWNVLKPLVASKALPEEVALNIARQRAILHAIKFVHNPQDRMVFEQWARGFIPFWFAKNQALRRAGRLAMTNPLGFERYVRTMMTMQSYGATSISNNDKQSANIMPGSIMGGKLMSTFLRTLGLSPSGNVPIGLRGSTSSLASVFPWSDPSGENPNSATSLFDSIRPDFGPMASLPIRWLDSQNPYSKSINTVNDTALGPVGSQTSMFQQLVPNSMLRSLVSMGTSFIGTRNETTAAIDALQTGFIAQALTDRHDQLYVGAKKQAITDWHSYPDHNAEYTATHQKEFHSFVDTIANAYINQGITDENGKIVQRPISFYMSDPNEQKDLINKTHRAALAMYAGRTALSFFSPESLSVTAVNPEMQKLVADVQATGGDYTKADKILQKHPKLIYFLTRGTASATGLPLPATLDMANFQENNADLFKQSGNSSGLMAFVPYTNAGKKFDNHEYHTQMAAGLRRALSPADIMNKMAVAIGNNYVYNTLPELNKKYENGSSSALSDTRAYYASQNVAWRKSLGDSGPSRIQALQQVRDLLQRNDIDQREGFKTTAPLVREILSQYDSMSQQYRDAMPGYHKYLDDQWKSWIQDYVKKHPAVTIGVNAIFGGLKLSDNK